MACSTCGQTMHGIGYGMWHCPTCGTLKGGYADGAVTVPALVERCRLFEQKLSAPGRILWHIAGIDEAIKTPEERSS